VEYFKDRDDDFRIACMLGKFGKEDEPELCTVILENPITTIDRKSNNVLATIGNVNFSLPNYIPLMEGSLAIAIKRCAALCAKQFKNDLIGIGRIVVITKDSHVEETFIVDQVLASNLTN
jgi:hypothetical protein